MDRIQTGALASRVLTEWERRNRYAGSKDRAAIADIIYDVLRRKRSLAARGGGADGRALMLGYLRDLEQDPETVFGVGRYAPDPLTEAERSAGHLPAEGTAEEADIPEWLWPDLQASLGPRTQQIAGEMQKRAPIHLRVNLTKLTRDRAIRILSEQGIEGRPHPLSPTAIEIVEGARKVKNAKAYLDGMVELQDASSQAVSDLVPLKPGQTLLDFCAGGGGKTLAIAGRVTGVFVAHDAEPRRMNDLPARADRAGAAIKRVSSAELGLIAPFDTVLVDAPCSGSGSWRRDPQGKWLLTRKKLDQTIRIQRDILETTAALVRPQGHLVYATCSLLAAENQDQIAAFLAQHPEFSMSFEQQFTPLNGGDGFYCAVLLRD
nr:RsmB/NOP family class I SAM-dependent RNA methyltransferase [Cognatishimia sp. MH4019]